jgi:hypothetical protein
MQNKTGKNYCYEDKREKEYKSISLFMIGERRSLPLK